MRKNVTKLTKKTLHFFSLVLAPLTVILKICKIHVLGISYPHIGHLALDVDCYLRYRELYKFKSIPILFVRYGSPVHNRFLPSSKVCNQFLLNCWKRKIFTIDNWLLYILLWPIFGSDLLIYKMVRFYSTKAYPAYALGQCYAAIYSKCKKNFRPKINLTSEEVRRGENLLTELGLPKGSWYVCFYCRDPSYYNCGAVSNDSSVRNADISTYELALKEITKQGGWCIRMGSKQTAPLPFSLPQIIDYPKSQFVSDFMDIFLISRCLFFLGSNSGISNVATIFGISILMANYVPMGQLSVFHRDINIFKLYKNNKTGELVPFKQMLESYLSYSLEPDYGKFQLSVVDNTAEEIRDAVIEMLHEMKIINTPYNVENELQNQFLSLLNEYNISYYGSPRIGSSFLRKYSYLI